MTTTLIVLAHPDRSSFNRSWARVTERASQELGHEVIWSDLTSNGFDPVERANHYADEVVGDKFDVLKVQEAAARAERLPADVSEELEKLRRADRVVFHFPMWWFAPPAILKGWFDRVLVHGALQDTAHRFDTGRCLGKKALFCVTTGSSDAESGYNGREGDATMLLWPAAHTLRYLGFTVLVPHIVHGIHGYHRAERKDALEEALQRVLEQHSERMAQFDRLATMQFNSDDDFDGAGRLKDGRPSHSRFIRHTP